MGKSVDLHAAANFTLTTTTHADGLGGHLLSRALENLSIHEFGHQCGWAGLRVAR
jgi:hypothetical protein